MDYINQFNSNIVSLLTSIIDQGISQKQIKNITFFHLNQSLYSTSDNLDSRKLFVDQIIYEDEHSIHKLSELALTDKWLGYYWAQFDLENATYKIDMFFKACDRETGNLHIFPGAIQVFRYEEKHNHSYIKNGRYINREENISSGAYKEHTGSLQYCEEHWVPVNMLDKSDKEIPMLWDHSDILIIAKNFWEYSDCFSVNDLFYTISVTNGYPESVKRFYSINGEFSNWYDILYPPQNKLPGRKLNTAYHLLKFYTDRKNLVQIHNFHIFEIEGYGYFNLYAGEAIEYSFEEKLKKNSSYADEEHFLTGPSYLVDNADDPSKKDWQLVYPFYKIWLVS